MKKADKKQERAIVTALTLVCEQAKKQFDGFKWLTHQVDYDNFDASFKITCFFCCTNSIKNVTASDGQSQLFDLVSFELAAININLGNVAEHILFRVDDSEDCRHVTH